MLRQTQQVLALALRSAAGASNVFKVEFTASLGFLVQVTAATGTGKIYLDTSPDGVTWFTAEQSSDITAAVGFLMTMPEGYAKYVKVRYTVGTNMTFSVDMIVVEDA